jgi:hypothetical protein
MAGRGGARPTPKRRRRPWLAVAELARPQPAATMASRGELVRSQPATRGGSGPASGRCARVHRRRGGARRRRRRWELGGGGEWGSWARVPVVGPLVGFWWVIGGLKNLPEVI